MGYPPTPRVSLRHTSGDWSVIFTSFLLFQISEIVRVTMMNVKPKDVEEIMLTHKVGGWYLTLEERERMRAVLNMELFPTRLSCRVKGVCSWFLRPEESETDLEHVFCCTSFNITLDDLKEMRGRYLMRGPPLFPKNVSPMIYLVQTMVDECEIKSAEWILEHCFTFYSCDEHNCCKSFFEVPEKLFCFRRIRFSCCNDHNCVEFSKKDGTQPG